MTYHIKEPLADPELEKAIEELRKKMKIEETRKQEEERNRAVAKKKQQEVKDRRKVTTEDQQQSYDIKGKPVEIQTLPALPAIAAKCGQVFRNEKSQDMEKTAKPKGRSMRRLDAIKKDISVNEENDYWTKEISKTVMNKQRDQNVNYFPMRGMYEALVPATGVTFAEKGKNTKSGNLTMREKLGKISKTDYLTQMADSSMKNTSSFYLSSNPFTPSNQVQPSTARNILFRVNE